VPILFVVGAVFIVALVIAVVAQSRRVGRLAKRLDALTAGANGVSLEGALGQHFDRVVEVRRALDQLENRTAAVEQDLRSTLGRVGLVRYNPFENTGGNQSFALAILDPGGNGFVISSLHARDGTRIYAKAIEAGRADTALSAEEADAVKRAVSAAPASKA
jgi:hypothetical protein